MGAVLFPGGTTFRVWAPNADAVAVHGTFDDWASDGTPMAREEGGHWSVDVPGAVAGHEYRFLVRHGDQVLSRLDPRARQLTSSVGNAVVVDPDAFDWGDQDFHPPAWNDLVILELHVGTFTEGIHGRPGTLDGVRRRLGHLRELGIGAIQLMPPFEFAGDRSWGYNPAYPYAVESTYGAGDDLKALVRAAHEAGIAVILDVVYNHLGPSDLDLWRFDGWSEHDKGGIYFYQDHRSATPWGDTRPDYGRPEVRAFLRDNALMWLEEFRIDGLRWDATAYIRAVDGTSDALPDGVSLMQAINQEVAERFPGRLMIAEDLRGDPWVTRPVGDGGLGFGAQWDAVFVHAVRAALIASDDAERDLDAIAATLRSGDDHPFRRVIFTESHDEVANGRARVPEEIWPGYAESWPSRKRAALGAALLLTTPGIPMLFQGQELVEGSWFSDDQPLDWSRRHRFAGLFRLHRDLVGLRRNAGGVTAGLRGGHISVHHLDRDRRILAYHRWLEGGPADDVLVLVSLSGAEQRGVRVGVPRAGAWRVRFNTDLEGYDPEFASVTTLDADSRPEPCDGMAESILVDLGPYAAVILSQDP
jgi:1,4-alpha-glucan branching enzyme